MMPETEGPNSTERLGEDGGERILALGNKRLLGIFLMASLLCGAFFTLGYLAGRNSPAADGSDAATSTRSDIETVQKPGTKHDGLLASGNASGNAPPVMPTAVASAPPAAKSASADNPAASGERQLAPAPHASAPADSEVSVSVAETGAYYWQVYALGRPAADNQVKILRTKELPVIMVESSRAHAYRVLAGPYRNAGAFADAKEKLKTLGYQNVIPFRP